MALTAAQPSIAREHLLRATSRQFVAGDVQHWWLPPAGQGVRTRIGDDRVWLAYAVAHYIEATGDVGILDESSTLSSTGRNCMRARLNRFFSPRSPSIARDAV